MGVDGTAAYELAEGGRTEGGAVRREKGQRSAHRTPPAPLTAKQKRAEGLGPQTLLQEGGW